MPTQSFLDQPKTSTSALADALGINRSPSDLVALDREQVAVLAAHIAVTMDVETTPAKWDDPLFWNVNDEPAARSQYFAIGNALNFRFWRLEGKTMVPSVGTIDGIPYRGAMYMWRSLRRALQTPQIPILDATFLRDLTDEAFDEIFIDDEGTNPLAFAREDRLANLRDLGTQLSKDWDGAFFNVVTASGGSLAEFARISNRFRAFDDPLMKLTMVNAILHSGSGVYEFDADPLPAIDYHLLRHALRQGLIRPRPELSTKLTIGELLSPEEAFELRRVALAAFLDISEATGVSGALLDNKYWLNRVNCTETPVCLDLETASRCPFFGACAQLVDFALPIELTRYY